MTELSNWYHAHIDAVSRGEGKSAVGLAAYMTGETMKDERTGLWCKRNHPGEVSDWGTTAPKDAPTYLTDDDQLSKAWNAVEASETRKNSHVANHWNIGSSREFSEADHIQVAQQMAQKLTDRYGVMVTWAVHKPTDHGDDRNWHIHLGYNMRRIDEDGFGEKAREITTKQTRVEETIWQRKMFADVLNDRLELIGSNERVSHETYERQGKDREPTQHLGNKQNQMELQGVRTPTGDENRDIAERNRQRLGDRIEFMAQADAQIQAGIQEMADPDRYTELQMATDNATEKRILAEQKDALVEKSREMGAIKEKLDQHEAQTKASAEKAQAAQDERRKTDEERAKEGGIPSAEGRYAEALGNTYDVRRPYASLANAAMAEHGIISRENAEMKRQSAEAKTPEERADIDRKRQIMGLEYMGLTSERLAGMSAVIAGREDAPSAVMYREKAASYRDQAQELRGEHQRKTEGRDKQDRLDMAEKIANLAKDVGRGQPVERPRNVTGNPAHTESRQTREEREARIISAENGHEAVVARQTQEQAKREGLPNGRPTEGAGDNAERRTATVKDEAARAPAFRSHSELTGKAPPERGDGKDRSSGGGQSRPR